MQKQAFFVFALSVLLCGTITAQQPGQEVSAQQVQDLTTVLQETRAELQACRGEIRELRGELQQLRQQVEARNAPAAVPAAGSSSLEQRVTALEDEQQSVNGKLEDHEQTKIGSGSRYPVKVSGLILLNAYSNIGHFDNSEVPNLAFATPAGAAGGDFGATLRQTLLNIQVTGPRIGGAQTSGDVAMDFSGGIPQTLDGVTMGVLRLTVARMRFDWTNTSLIAGQDAPFISPLSPTSYASLSTPALGYSGNLWTWTPQVRVERRWTLREGVQSALEVGFLDPLNGEYPADEFERDPEAGERSRHPAFAARSAWKFHVFDRDLTLAAGGYVGRQNYGYDRNVTAWAATADWQIPLGHAFDLSGEFFRGRALGGLWGGIGSSIVRDGSLANPATQVAGLDTVGGWTQLKWRAMSKLEFNAAFGQDNPFAADLRQFTPLPGVFVPFARNQAVLFNVIHYPRSNLLLSLEYRHLNTREASGSSDDGNQVNAAIGVSF